MDIAQDLLIPEDIRTSKILLEIANTIFPWIQLTSDCPSLNPSKYMPILDIQCCVTDNQIRFKFFKKPVSNHLLISKNSAMPYQTKRAALSSEALRRLRNTSEELPWEVKAEILSEFSLKCSGWD